LGRYNSEIGPARKKAYNQERMDSEKIKFLYAVQSLLQYHQVIGIDGFPASEDISSFLQTVDVSIPPVHVVSRESQVLSVAAQRAVDKKIERAVGKEISGTCEDIVGEVRSCTGCILHAKRLSTVPGLGSSNNPRLFIVGGWLVEEKGASLPMESVFGPEEDRMVARMLAAMDLTPDEAFITNVIKCSIPGNCEPSPENIHSCLSFLRRQIQVLNPAIICTMGIVATKALLKNTQPLSQLRGRMYPITVSERVTIPVIPTYHPTFLLKNPEFKRATWEDLQVIGKYLHSQNKF
jgi:uracil-DNA glycosylase